MKKIKDESILIVGQGKVGKMADIMSNIIIENNTIIIDGIQYLKKEKNEYSDSIALGMIKHFSGMYFKPRPNVDIVDEYKLILQKNSNLSRNNRDWVIRTFHANYIKKD